MQTKFEYECRDKTAPKQKRHSFAPITGERNATNRSGGWSACKKTSCGPGMWAALKSSLLFTLGVLGCVAVVVAVVAGTTPPGSRKDPLAKPYPYWRITADVRTALEMLRYALEPEANSAAVW